jgi:hypothetical protein
MCSEDRGAWDKNTTGTITAFHALLCGNRCVFGHVMESGSLQGGHHQRLLQPRWWLLLDPPVAPPMGPTIDVFFNPSGGPCQTHHQCLLQPRWWPLSDPPVAPLRGPAIDVSFDLDGGYYRTHRQHPLGSLPSTSSSTSVVVATKPAGSAPQGHHRRLLQLRWRPLPDPPAAPPNGPTIDAFLKLVGGHCRTHWQRPPGDPPSSSYSILVVAAIGLAGSAP